MVPAFRRRARQPPRRGRLGPRRRSTRPTPSWVCGSSPRSSASPSIARRPAWANGPKPPSARAETSTPGRRCAVLAAAAWKAVLEGDLDLARTRASEALRDGLPPDTPSPGWAHSALASADSLAGDHAAARADARGRPASARRHRCPRLRPPRARPQRPRGPLCGRSARGGPRARRGGPPAGPHARQPEPAHRCAPVVRRDASTRRDRRNDPGARRMPGPQPRRRHPRRTRRAAASRVARQAPCSSRRTRPSHRGATRRGRPRPRHRTVSHVGLRAQLRRQRRRRSRRSGARGDARRCRHRRAPRRDDLLGGPRARRPSSSSSTTPEPNSAPIATTPRTRPAPPCPTSSSSSTPSPSSTDSSPWPAMAELPSGTVTFLFTDLEGSTRLWEEHPDAMQDGAGASRRVLCAASRRSAKRSRVRHHTGGRGPSRAPRRRRPVATDLGAWELAATGKAPAERAARTVDGCGLAPAASRPRCGSHSGPRRTLARSRRPGAATTGAAVRRGALRVTLADARPDRRRTTTGQSAGSTCATERAAGPAGDQRNL